MNLILDFTVDKPGIFLWKKAWKNHFCHVDNFFAPESYPHPAPENKKIRGCPRGKLWITLWIMWKDSKLALFRIFRAILYTNPAADRGFLATDFRNYS